MPSNAELKASIDALAAELGVEVNTDGRNNAQLADLLSDLRDEKAKRAETPSQAAAEQAAAEQTVKPYYMAPGKAVTSKAGILSGDTADEVKAEFFEGGDETLRALVESGYVLKA